MKEFGEYLVLDVGTTSVKVSILDRHFRILTHFSQEYRLETEGNLVEMEPQGYIRAVENGIRQAADSRPDGQGLGKIRGIAITTQGETLIPVDARGNALDKAIVWLDGRAEGQAASIRKLVPDQVFYETTGVPQCTGQCPVSKLLWIKEEKPDLYEKTAYFLLLEDYLIHWFTGKMATESALMATTGYFDIRRDRLWTELLEQIGIAPGKIPEIRECAETVGTVLPKRAQELGFSEHTTVVTGAMDQICSALGAGNCIPGMITETTGTAMCMGVTVSDFHVDLENKIPVYRHCRKGSYMLISICMTAGMVLKWFKDNFCREEMETARQEGISVYEVLDQMAEDAPPLSGGITMIPYLSGSIQPLEAPGLRGGFFGMGLENTKADFVRSIMEGVGYMLRENLELLERITGETARQVVSLGGGAKGACWCQIKADICNVRIQSRLQTETTSVGAAVLCAVGLGDYKTLEEAVSAIGTEGRSYDPDRQRAENYENGYRRYLDYLGWACKCRDLGGQKNGSE